MSDFTEVPESTETSESQVDESTDVLESTEALEAWTTVSDKVKSRPKKKKSQSTPSTNSSSTPVSEEETVILRRRSAPTTGKASRANLRQGNFQTVARPKSNKVDNRHLAKLDNDHEILQAPKLDRSWIQKIQTARQQRGLSQKDLAQKLNMDVGLINQYEKGSVLVPDGKVIDKINRFLFQK